VALSVDANSHRVRPGFLPLFGQLQPKLHRVHRGPAEASALGQVPAGTPGKDFSFDNIADGALIGFGDLICSSQTSIADLRIAGEIGAA
jgi:hypothetical protein